MGNTISSLADLFSKSGAVSFVADYAERVASVIKATSTVLSNKSTAQEIRRATDVGRTAFFKDAGILIGSKAERKAIRKSIRAWDISERSAYAESKNFVCVIAYSNSRGRVRPFHITSKSEFDELVSTEQDEE